jgi:hypothetical protein
VDRIRLLGNGVVPSTAAKAWQVLDAELTPPTVEQKTRVNLLKNCQECLGFI